MPIERKFKPVALAMVVGLSFGSVSAFAEGEAGMIDQIVATIDWTALQSGVVTVISGAAVIVLGIAGWKVIKSVVKSGH